MRFLALQTNVEVLKRQFIPQGEHELLTATRHPLFFLLAFLWNTIVALGFLIVMWIASVYLEGMTSQIVIGLVLAAGMLVYVLSVITTYIAWRFNYIIITSEKILIIKHRSFIHQNVDPIHLDNLASTKFESQYFGIVHCGIVHIALKEKATGSTRQLIMPYIRNPDAVTSAIENAISLKQQKKPGTDTPQQQEQKVETIKETLQEIRKPASPPTESA